MAARQYRTGSLFFFAVKAHRDGVDKKEQGNVGEITNERNCFIDHLPQASLGQVFLTTCVASFSISSLSNDTMLSSLLAIYSSTFRIKHSIVEIR